MASTPSNNTYVDEDGDGVSPEDGDCDDTDPDIFHGAPEVTGDGVDSNCDWLDRASISASTATAIFTPPIGKSWAVGTALAIQDVTGDGVGDVIMGAPGWGDGSGDGDGGGWYPYNRVFVGEGQALVADSFDVIRTLATPERTEFGFLATGFDHGLDADGDGAPDLMMRTTYPEAAFVATSPIPDGWRIEDALTVAESDKDNDKLLWSALFWPDTNGDGAAEILTSYQDNGVGTFSIHESPHSGVFGRDDGAIVTSGFPGLGDGIPYKMKRVPDQTGDGRPELLFVWLGASLEPPQRSEPVMLADLSTDPVQSWYYSTAGVSDYLLPMGGGDLTGDGFSDLIISQPTEILTLADPIPGTVYIADRLPEDGSRGALESMGYQITGAQVGDEMGIFALAADLDGDGQLDLIVSAGVTPKAQPAPGRVHVFYGPITGDLNAEDADLVITGAQANDRFGTAVAVGDVNNDGVVDLAVAASAGGPAQSGAGRVYLFDGVGLWRRP